MTRPTRALVAEVALLTLVAAAAAASLPLQAGYFGWSWDALNHHVYLGLMAESPRLGHDVIAASYQSYQYPYLYWPVYRLGLLNAPGAVVAAGWVATQAALLLPPVWLLAYRLLPGHKQTWAAVCERAVACGVAFMSLVVLAGFETTANDLLVAVPVLWAFALMAAGSRTTGHAAIAAGLWGVSVAFKMSNAVYLPALLAWWWAAGEQPLTLRRLLGVIAGAAAAYGVAYAPWGWQLWELTGNPFYPSFQSLFGAVTRP